MPKIQILPEQISNKIAAGEVIVRPANGLKEILENAIDAGATKIKIIIEDAGKILIEVIDNGVGIPNAEMRMAFERHATSKIKHFDDLYNITTMGFRGEALSSIAAVAKVIIRSKTADEKLGTQLVIEHNQILNEEPVVMETGTDFKIHHLFFNVPARKNFLKSNQTEQKFLQEEFIRIALANPQIFFEYYSDSEQKYMLPNTHLLHRIVQIFGENYQKKLISIKEKTDFVEISGFIGKPEDAKKYRGQQFIYVNNRFIKNYILDYTVKKSYGNLLTKDHFPFYIIFLKIDPQTIDVNIHPTKQEIKFSDEKLICAILQSLIKFQLSQFNIIPPIDFELDPNITQSSALQHNTVKWPEINPQNAIPQNKDFTKTFSKNPNSTQQSNQHWTQFYQQNTSNANKLPFEMAGGKNQNQDILAQIDFEDLIQIGKTYLVAPCMEGFIVIHQQYAHERILYEKLLSKLESKEILSQKLIFPLEFQINPSDIELFTSWLPELSTIGFELEHFGKNSFIVQAIPSMFSENFNTNMLENILDQYQLISPSTDLKHNEKIIRCLAKSQSIKSRMALNKIEIISLVNELVSTTNNLTSPSGYPTFAIISDSYFTNFFSLKK
ncbi:MAG: DNA mismatch repair endonuclease MutL [Sediminibacterium sp.]|nr:DNA mismatch repair endonuclease MutL [Sediminibacterium sp.]